MRNVEYRRAPTFDDSEINIMLLVETKLGPSKIHGIGLFATKLIHKGTIIWKFVPGFDIAFTKEGVRNLPNEAKNFIKKYG